MKRLLSLACVAVLACSVVAVAEEPKEDAKKFSAVCPVSGKAAKEDVSSEYKGGKVYFCCANCQKAFGEDSAKFSAKANMQLVATGQAKLAKCPIAGRPLNPATKISVGGVDVCFCCNNCKGKATAAEGDKQIELIFADAAFAKGFEMKKVEK